MSYTNMCTKKRLKKIENLTFTILKYIEIFKKYYCSTC